MENKLVNHDDSDPKKASLPEDDNKRGEKENDKYTSHSYDPTPNEDEIAGNPTGEQENETGHWSGEDYDDEKHDDDQKGFHSK